MRDTETRPTQTDVAAFLANVEPDQRRTDAEALATLMQTVACQPPRMWGPSIIGFGTRHYRYDSGREGDTFRIGFSPRKPQLVLYLTGAVEADGDLLAQLGPHTTGKGCVYVKRLDRLDRDVLAELLTHCWQRENNGC